MLAGDLTALYPAAPGLSFAAWLAFAFPRAHTPQYHARTKHTSGGAALLLLRLGAVSLPTHLPACPPARLPACLRACLPACLRACLPAFLSVHRSIYLSMGSVHLSAPRCVSLSHAFPRYPPLSLLSSLVLFTPPHPLSLVALVFLLLCWALLCTVHLRHVGQVRMVNTHFSPEP